MKLTDLGFDVKTGFHDRRLTSMESRFLGILWEDHAGEKNALPAILLAIRFHKNCSLGFARAYELSNRRALRKLFDLWKREVRTLHNHLLQHHSNIPILSKAGVTGGYWIAENEAEAARFYDTFRKRGLTGLVKASRGKQAALVDMVQQISFEFEDLVDDASGFTPRIKPAPAMPTPVEVVDAFLERMTRNPEKYADGLKKLREKHGSVLLPKKQVAAMQMKAKELQEMVAGLGG